MKGFTVDPKRFMDFMGLCAGTADLLSEEYVSNRGRIQQAVTLLLALFTRVENKSVLLPEVVPFLRAAACIACNLSQMWDPTYRSLCSPSLAEKIFAPASDLDRHHLLEYTLSSKDERKVQAIDSKIQNLLWSLDASLFTMFGCAFSSLRPDVYKESACFFKYDGEVAFPAANEAQAHCKTLP